MESKEKEKMWKLIDSVSKLVDNIDDCGPLLGTATLHQFVMLRAREHLLVSLSILLEEYKTLYCV